MHASLADILTDLVQNSIEAGSNLVNIVFIEDIKSIRFTVEDNGRGMNKDTLERVDDPFRTDGIKHPGRRVGLGIPFLRQTAEQVGGRVDINSSIGKGTRVEAEFPADHLDLPPVGDLVQLWVQCLSFGGDYEMTIRRVRRDSDDRESLYDINRTELSEALGGLEDAGALGLLMEYVRSLEESLLEIDEEGDS